MKIKHQIIEITLDNGKELELDVLNMKDSTMAIANALASDSQLVDQLINHWSNVAWDEDLLTKRQQKMISKTRDSSDGDENKMGRDAIYRIRQVWITGMIKLLKQSGHTDISKPLQKVSDEWKRKHIITTSIVGGSALLLGILGILAIVKNK